MCSSQQLWLDILYVLSVLDIVSAELRDIGVFGTPVVSGLLVRWLTCVDDCSGVSGGLVR